MVPVDNLPVDTKALEALRVSARYGSHRADHRLNHRTEALSNISLDVSPGELLAVIGPNGAGKTSLVRALTGLLELSQGEVRLFGCSLHRLTRRDIARRIAVVPQHANVAFDFTVEQVVSMGRAPHQGSMLVGSTTDMHIVHEALQRTHLTSLASRRVSSLSGGEQKRVAIARALAQQPDVLILDEAGADLDIRFKVEIMSIVRQEIEQRNLACVAIMHDLGEVAQVADRVAVLLNAQLRAIGTVEQVMTREVLRDVFCIDLDVGHRDSDGTRYFIPIRPNHRGPNNKTP